MLVDLELEGSGSCIPTYGFPAHNILETSAVLIIILHELDFKFLVLNLISYFSIFSFVSFMAIYQVYYGTNSLDQVLAGILIGFWNGFYISKPLKECILHELTLLKQGPVSQIKFLAALTILV